MITKTLRTREVSIAGVVIVLSQLGSNALSTHSVSSDISQLKAEFHKSQIERETYFVRKDELETVVTKLDIVNDQLIRLNEQLLALKEAMKHRYSIVTYDR